VPAALAPDETAFEVTWKPDTVLIDATSIAASLTNPAAADGVYRFEPALAELADVEPGQVLVLTGVDLVKVTAVDLEADAQVVTTEPATLLEAVTDADLSWDIGADLSRPIQVDDSTGALRPLAVPTLRCTPETPENCKSSYSGNLGNLKATHEMETEDDGTLKMTSSLEYPQQGQAVLKISALRGFDRFATREPCASNLAHCHALRSRSRTSTWKWISTLAPSPSATAMMPSSCRSS
jgi:hypothetical protein